MITHAHARSRTLAHAHALNRCAATAWWLVCEDARAQEATTGKEQPPNPPSSSAGNARHLKMSVRGVSSSPPLPAVVCVFPIVVAKARGREFSKHMEKKKGFPCMMSSL